jgi:hypothetical protein
VFGENKATTSPGWRPQSRTRAVERCVVCSFISDKEIRSLVCASVKPATEEGLWWRGEAGEAKSHCHVVRLPGTGAASVSRGLYMLNGCYLRSMSGWVLLNGIVKAEFSNGTGTTGTRGNM